MSYIVWYADGKSARRLTSSFLHLPNAERARRTLKNRGMTAWIETDEGVFVPVKGASKATVMSYYTKER